MILQWVSTRVSSKPALLPTWQVCTSVKFSFLAHHWRRQWLVQHTLRWSEKELVEGVHRGIFLVCIQCLVPKRSNECLSMDSILFDCERWLKLEKVVERTRARICASFSFAMWFFNCHWQEQKKEFRNSLLIWGLVPNLSFVLCDPFSLPASFFFFLEDAKYHTSSPTRNIIAQKPCNEKRA